MLTQMKVHGLAFDPYQNTYIVILKDDERNEVIPIWIGRPEAHAIGLAMEGVFPQRPMTHDLITNIMDIFQAKVISVVLTQLKDATYYSKIHLAYNDAELTLDARPSDAIALAVRANAPIFAHEDIPRSVQTDAIHELLEGLNSTDTQESEEED